MRKKILAFVLLIIFTVGATFLFQTLPSEYVPDEDKGTFAVAVSLPEGTALNRTAEISNRFLREIDKLDYGFKVLSNGLKVLLISDPDTNKSSAALGVNIGHLVDKKDEQGLAHFCEHLLFMGSKKYPNENEYSDYIVKNGGDYNASTQRDRTIYYK